MSFLADVYVPVAFWLKYFAKFDFAAKSNSPLTPNHIVTYYSIFSYENRQLLVENDISLIHVYTLNFWLDYSASKKKVFNGLRNVKHLLLVYYHLSGPYRQSACHIAILVKP
jgi:hypothetical protein